jgi:hypothetical protein
MAQFLTIALKATIVVSKKRIFNDRIPVEVAIETVEKNYNLSLYEHSETEHFHLWKLKQDILDAEIIPFLEVLIKFYYDKEAANLQGIIGAIKRNKSYESLFKLAKDAEYEHFEMDSKQFEKCHLETKGKHLQVDYNYFQLFKSERLRVDKIDKTFVFLLNCLKHKFAEFQLTQALEIYTFDAK